MKRAERWQAASLLFLIWAGFNQLITWVWQALEVYYYGQIQPREVDTWITAIFAAVLTVLYIATAGMEEEPHDS